MNEDFNTNVVNNRQSSKKISSLISLPFFWIVLTTFYIVLTFAYGFPASGGTVGFGVFLFRLIGVFVPLGIWTLYSSMGAMLPVVLLVIFGGEWLIRKYQLTVLQKVIVIFIFLFLLTMFVDIIVYGQWVSLFALFGGKLLIE